MLILQKKKHANNLSRMIKLDIPVITFALLHVAWFINCTRSITAFAPMSCFFFYRSGVGSSASPAVFRATADAPIAPLAIT